MRLTKKSVVSKTLLLLEGGVPVGGGGRWIHNPVIYKEIGTNIISPTTSVSYHLGLLPPRSPTTSVFDHSSFPKEESFRYYRLFSQPHFRYYQLFSPPLFFNRYEETPTTLFPPSQNPP